MTEQEIKDEIIVIWTELGRDVTKLKLDTKTEEQLEEALVKLKAVRMSFKILFDPNGNHALAVHLLANIFQDGREQGSEDQDEKGTGEVPRESGQTTA